MSLYLICIAIFIAFVSGIPGLFLANGSLVSQRIAVSFIVMSMLSGLCGAVFTLLPDLNIVNSPITILDCNLIAVDSLSAFFLIPIFMMGGLGALYGLGYWSQRKHASNSKKLQLFWGILIAAMAIIVISKHAFLFLFGWETMAIAAFFLVSTEDNRPDSRNAAWIYLIATHISTLTLFALFSLWKQLSGSYLLSRLETTSDTVFISILFILAMLGFGLKAGIMPLHFWLPSAHATAPSHVSAILSGVVLKIGIYGLVRWLSLFPEPPIAWGSIILAVGCISGLLGVIFAIAQHNLKRLLAYHSVENIGIIFIGLGVAVIGKSLNEPLLLVSGMAGCLLHIWNHSLFKSLLFFCAGAVVHSTHTLQMDKLGGLSKNMPWTAAMFLIGAVAICGLPPLNGFISEMFVYLGLFRIVTKIPNGFEAAVGIAALSMIGALAAACFVKVYGTVFLGNRREEAINSHDGTLSMKLPMLVLALLCILIGVAPGLFSSGIMNAVSAWVDNEYLTFVNINEIIPVKMISILGTITIAAVFTLVMIVICERKNTDVTGTWDCGYIKPTARMQYTPSSFADSITVWFSWIVRPKRNVPEVSELFPREKYLKSHIDEPVLDRFVLPAGEILKKCSSWFHRFQHGLIQHYILYIVIMLLLLLCIQMPVKDIISSWFIH